VPQVLLALAVASRGLGLQLEVRREEVVVGWPEPSSSDLPRRPWAPEFVPTAAEEDPAQVPAEAPEEAPEEVPEEAPAEAPEEAVEEEAAKEAVEAAEVAGGEVAGRQTRRGATECCQLWAPVCDAVNSLGGNRS
jgi:hypothetical protein